jgi:hypothetical protein
MKLLAQFGAINNPLNTLAPGRYAGTNGEGLVMILSNLVKMVIVVGGLYAFWNLLTAGFTFMSAGGDPKAISKAWDKIWQSIVGLLIVAGSFVIAVIIGALIFGSANATILISPRIYTP